MLVTITIIGLMAGMMFGALLAARETGKEAATKATIAKLNSILMRRYESYLTRRVPVDLSKTASGGTMSLTAQATDRLYAIRDLMRMEMPDRADDVTYGPITLPKSGGSLSRPALSRLYLAYYNANKSGLAQNSNNLRAEFLYMIVSMGSPEAMEQFNASEIGDTNGNGWPEFLDGWRHPIFFLRWAPGFSSDPTDPTKHYSDIQFADAVNHHDPFDPRRVDTNAYQLFPLIYSFGPDNKPGLNLSGGFSFATAKGSTGDVGDIFGLSNDNFTKMGSPSADDISGNGTLTDYQDNITNQQIGAR